MENLIYGVLFITGLFAGLYLGKVGELRRIRKGQKSNGQRKPNNNVVGFPNKKSA